MNLKSIAVLVVGLSTATGALADPVQWSSNGHWYEYNPEPVTWDVAYLIANSSTYAGMQGYLATVTSAEENMFVSNDVAVGDLAWLGGSDNGAANVNDWTWRNGPEAGQAFTYTSWNGGEPNNCCGGEDYVHTNWGGVGMWNDHGGPGNPSQRNGFLIEYSMAPVPEPETYALMLAGLGLVGAAARRRSRR